jgi:hypothetical protein
MGVATAVLRATVEQETGQHLLLEQMVGYTASRALVARGEVSPTRRAPAIDVSALSEGACLNVQTWARGEVHV